MDRTTPPRGGSHATSTGTGGHGRVTPTTNHNSSGVSKDHNVSGSSGGGITNSLGSGNRSHGYCLKWKYHPNNLLHMFNQLLLNESFTDVVVACEGRVIKCHKMVLSACSKYFEQVFCEYPLQNSTLVILKDYNYNDVQAIIEFMYQGEINVAHDRLQSLLKAAESLQVKGLADITGEGGSTTNTSGAPPKDDADYMASGHSADDSNPPSPVGDRKMEAGSSSIPEPPAKKRRGRPPLTPHIDSSSMDGGLMNLTTHQHMLSEDNQFDDFPLTNMLETHYTSPRPSKKARRKGASAAAGGGTGQGDLNVMDTHDGGDEAGSDDLEDDEVTEEDIRSIVKMTDYIEKGGSRPQFWDEPLTKKVMNAIKNKKMEMKAAAEYLGVSYSTLYSRYRELYGYLKMPANQDTNFNYYQVLNLLRAGQISLQDAAKRLNINERTLTAYLSTTITPKKPKTLKQGSSNLAGDSKSFGMGTSLSDLNPEDGLDSGNQNMDEFDEDDSDSDEAKNLHLPSMKSEMEEGSWRTGR